MPGKLLLNRSSSTHDFYCSKPENATATFPGLGSVVRQGDCIGIAISKDNGAKYWVVDNSRSNGYTTIWKSKIQLDIANSLTVKKGSTIASASTLKSISFDGFYGGQLHFTYQENSGASIDSREFVFDFKNEPIDIAIKGNFFKVYSANNIEIVYEWSKFK